jgi:hypothetical protein
VFGHNSAGIGAWRRLELEAVETQGSTERISACHGICVLVNGGKGKVQQQLV